MNRPEPSSKSTVLCERKSFRESLGLGGMIFCVLTLGLGFLVMYAIYALAPGKIWIEDGRIYADKILPPSGVSQNSVDKVTITSVSAATAELSRNAMVEIVEDGKRYIIAINRNYYPEGQVARSLKFFAEVKKK